MDISLGIFANENEPKPPGRYRSQLIRSLHVHVLPNRTSPTLLPLASP